MSNDNRGRARIGVLVPYTNCNLEGDFALMCPRGVSFHYARLGGYDIEEIPDDKQMAGLGASDLSEPLRLIKGVRPHAILYGCTSATLTHGPSFDRDLAGQITGDGIVSITAAGSLIHALRTIGVTRVGFASPYVGAINDQAAAFLASEGIETVSRADIGRDLGNYGQGELTPDEVYALALRANTDDVQALVLSCTDMRSVEVVERLEAATGKPVITSNQAMLFQTMQALGLSPGWAPGQLFGHL
ncbi:MAG: maleate cis-trans isomerase family protein [Pikeienuella sp.]